MANPQLGHDQDDGEERACRCQTRPQRAQPLSDGWQNFPRTRSRSRPFASSDDHQKLQNWPLTPSRYDIGTRRLPESAVDSKYETPCRRSRGRLHAHVPPSKCANKDSPSITTRRLARHTAQSHSLPDSDTESELKKMMRQPETRPISHGQVLTAARFIYDGLIRVERKCIEVDKAASANLDYDSDWQALITLHRQISFEDDGPSNISFVKASKDPDLGALLSEVSLHSQRFCRLNSRLLPLLQPTKGSPSCVRFTEFLTLVGALSDILSQYSSLLDFTDTILTGLFDLITSIIRRLNLRFRSAYEELKCRNASTQIIFEFPNNMRHVCTTMPWTILPALLVLWGVCWMFIIGPGDLEPGKFKAPVPTFSPAPAVYDLLEDSGTAYYEPGLQSVLMPEPSTTDFDQHPTIDSLLFNDGGVGIDPIYLVQPAPQDPDFLSFDVLSRNGAGIVETSAKEDLTGQLPAAVTPDPTLQAYGDANRQEPFKRMVNDASVGQIVQDTGSDEKSISYFACPKCQQTFANSFTLNRHQTEAHNDAAASPEESFPCPNRGCKRSAKGSPFKRLHNLKRHLQVCKHNPDVSTSSAESDVTEERPLSHSISTPALPDGLQPAEPPSEDSSGESSVRKRSRSENDDDWSEESLLREMKKKLKRMAQEVKEKEDAYLQAQEGLESIQKTIRIMEDSLRKS